jgi:hypothetical protein
MFPLFCASELIWAEAITIGVSRRRGKKIARIAVARKLLGTIFHMMKEEIDYEEFLRRGSNAQ